MSLEEEDDYWNSSDAKAFNFDDEDLASATATTVTSATTNTANPDAHVPLSTTPTVSQTSNVKTLGSILAPKSSIGKPFLRPSMIMCNGDKIEQLIEHLDKCFSNPNNSTTNVNTTPNTTVTKQDPKLYISDIVNKRVPVNFSPYKSKREKLLLLDCAICCSDGNTITAAAIFISKTLKQSIFLEEMRRRPIAIDHYVNYLEITGKSRESLQFLKKLGSTN